MSFLYLGFLFICIHASLGEDRTWVTWQNNRYFLSDQSGLLLELDYTDSLQYCQNLNATLASVHSIEETNFLVNNSSVSFAAYWFGLHQKSTTVPTDCMCGACNMNNNPDSEACSACTSCRSADNWQWEDGTEYDWMNWRHDQPNAFNTEKCARFHGDGKWYDDVCDRKYYFICKQDHINMETAPTKAVISTRSTETEEETTTLNSTYKTNEPSASTVVKGDGNKTVIIAVVVVVVVILVAVGVVGGYLVYRTKRRKSTKHDYINTGEYAEMETENQPKTNGVSYDYADAVDEETEDLAYASSVPTLHQQKSSSQEESDIYNKDLTMVSEDPPEYAVVDKSAKKNKKAQPVKPPRTKGKKNKAPPPPTGDSNAVYAVPNKGKKAKAKQSGSSKGNSKEPVGIDNAAIIYAEPNKPAKVTNNAQPAPGLETEYQDVDNVPSELNGEKPLPKPRPKPRVK